MLCESAKQLEPNKNPFLTHYGAACCILDFALILYNIWHYGELCNIEDWTIYINIIESVVYSMCTFAFLSKMI